MSTLLIRDQAVKFISEYFDNGSFINELNERVKIQTDSRSPEKLEESYKYLNENITPYLNEIGFDCKTFDNPKTNAGPFLIANRIEDEKLPTIFSYGHGDVVPGYDSGWFKGLKPWEITQKGNKYYGRGTADNKGQHSINLAALKTVLKFRKKLGFNFKLLLETGEEIGSPGLNDFCNNHKELLKSDFLIASDGPRINLKTPTIYLGTRGVINFTMHLKFREGGHHSGNWGGLLSNPAIVLSHAISTIVSRSGEILIKELKAKPLSNSIRNAISKLKHDGGENSPEIDPNWGEPGLTKEEKVFGSNTFEIRSFKSGNIEKPANAVPPSATAYGHMRYIKGTMVKDILPIIQNHLSRNGFPEIEVKLDGVPREATQLEPDHPYVEWAKSSIEKTTNKNVAIMPNLGGSLPNDIFVNTLKIPTIWVPHSYGGCSQHAPNEHILGNITKESLQIMTGIWWDLGENPPKIIAGDYHG